MEEILIPIAFFATFFGAFYVFYTTRNKERMALIEKGADASLFNTGKEPLSLKKFPIKFGMFLAGVGLGLLVGFIVESFTNLEEGIVISAGIMIFGGLSLVWSYFIARKVD